MFFRLGSQQMYVLPSTLCQFGELPHIMFRPEGTYGIHHLLELDGVVEELVHEDMIHIRPD